MRSIVELPFAFIKHLMHYTRTRFLGLEKNDQYHLASGGCLQPQKSTRSTAKGGYRMKMMSLHHSARFWLQEGYGDVWFCYLV